MKKVSLIKQYFLDLINASTSKNFVEMNEIYCEIERILNGKISNKIFFSQLYNNKIILPNGVADCVGNSNFMESLLYRDCKCMELYLTPLSLKTWQESFLNKNFSAKSKKIIQIEKNTILVDNEIKEILDIDNEDILKFDLTNGITVSKLKIQNLWLSLNLS